MLGARSILVYGSRPVAGVVFAESVHLLVDVQESDDGNVAVKLLAALEEGNFNNEKEAG